MYSLGRQSLNELIKINNISTHKWKWKFENGIHTAIWKWRSNGVVISSVRHCNDFEQNHTYIISQQNEQEVIIQFGHIFVFHNAIIYEDTLLRSAERHSTINRGEKDLQTRRWSTWRLLFSNACFNSHSITLFTRVIVIAETYILVVIACSYWTH